MCILSLFLLNQILLYISPACGPGFKLEPGDIPGWGQAGSFSNLADTEACGEACQDVSRCRSYEYSATEKKCNLNTDASPTAGVYRDYAFCVMENFSQYNDEEDEEMATENPGLLFVCLAAKILSTQNACQFNFHDFYFKDAADQDEHCCESWAHSGLKYAHLNCKVGRTINIVHADFGRWDNTTCGYHPDFSTDCHMASAAEKVIQECQGKTSCKVPSASAYFGGDPCVGTYKFLWIWYNCRSIRRTVEKPVGGGGGGKPVPIEIDRCGCTYPQGWSTGARKCREGRYRTTNYHFTLQL